MAPSPSILSSQFLPPPPPPKLVIFQNKPLSDRVPPFPVQVGPTSRRETWHPVVRCAGADERRELFSRIAPVYDNLNDLLSLGQHRVWKRMAVSWSGYVAASWLLEYRIINDDDHSAKKGDRVLDLCCGSGDLAFLFSEKVGSNGQVIGIDFSTEQLKVASSRQQSSSKAVYRNIEWIEGDATDLPFTDCYFDAITVGYGLRNIVDKRKAMKEMLRVLKPGSKVSVLDFNKSTEYFVAAFQEWMIDIVVVPVATVYGLAEEYEYLKSSIRQYLTGNELEELALESGFSCAKHYEISGGLMGNLVATR